MREFTSHEIFEVAARGRCYVVSRDQCPDDLWDMNALVGETVLLNGKPREITGVEVFKPFISPEHPYRLAFGLIARS